MFLPGTLPALLGTLLVGVFLASELGNCMGVVSLVLSADWLVRLSLGGVRGLASSFLASLLAFLSDILTSCLFSDCTNYKHIITTLANFERINHNEGPFYIINLVVTDYKFLVTYT